VGEAKRRAPHKPPPLPFDSMAAAWSLYAQQMLAGAPDLLREHMRRVFYTGAGAYRDLVLLRLDPGEEPTDADMRRMDRLEAEMVAFMEENRAEAMAQPPPPGSGH
jgi:hypothetical protein